MPLRSPIDHFEEFRSKGELHWFPKAPPAGGDYGDDDLPDFTKEMLSKSETIARGRGIRKIDEIVRKFGGSRNGWIKKKGWDSSGREWHWYEHQGIGRIGVKQPGMPDPF